MFYPVVVQKAYRGRDLSRWSLKDEFIRLEQGHPGWKEWDESKYGKV